MARTWFYLDDGAVFALGHSDVVALKRASIEISGYLHSSDC